MATVSFIKNVSKGTRFNQIYIPKYLEKKIEVGDKVEVKLIEKHNHLYYYKSKKLSQFKEDLIKNIFSFLSKFEQIESVFIVGSFLTKKIDYRDIDIIIILEKDINDFDKFIYNKLIDRFNLKFHVMSIKKNKFKYLLESCPLTRTMFNIYVSNKELDFKKKKIIDKKHLKFLLMMPEDLLEIELNSRIFFDNLRRLITIERFLENKDANLDKIEDEIMKLIGEKLYQRMKNDEKIEEKTIDAIRKIIKHKLKKIKKMI